VSVLSHDNLNSI
jgi:hypothetical protein